MLEQLNRELTSIMSGQINKRRWADRLERTEAGLKLEQVKIRSLKKQMDKEQRDVDRLTSLSVAGLVYLLTGRNPEKMDKEKREAIAARLKYEEAVKTSEDMQFELEKIKAHLASVQDVDQQYKDLMKRKEQLIRDQNSPLSETLYAMVELEAALKAAIRKYKEAIAAGDRARVSLEGAIESLKYTKQLSAADPARGEMMITNRTEARHSRDEIHEAQHNLRLFENELHDIRVLTARELEESGLLTFADYFFDGFVTDWFVHEQIRESEAMTYQTLRETKKMIRDLQRGLFQLKKQLEGAVRRRTAFIEMAK
ncbi:hypothetical protein [Sporolactobacillus sp. THM19-2]|uniref:hypothetical protein n=1 Tax=Sporolactobacillus sp. THM19-2 TaxID=2511171 RepID=UPI001021DB6D|nr:hypothetical protein [Sporolactobacillus sp. THM19-2]RYL92578.1 hypothetical protein EWH91_06870 [Sporolactobacillus sp. THM19-2]